MPRFTPHTGLRAGRIGEGMAASCPLRAALLRSHQAATQEEQHHDSATLLHRAPGSEIEEG
ncbi:hypothetical protein [Paenibacillus jiagnxiensis]|uniref:hypothetical protein n=1 Tax=Paenibacillus jiagnxiensis TaxID=3228926 RepID=UPI0038D413E4